MLKGTTSRAPSRRLVAVVGGFLGLHVFMAWKPVPTWWSLDMLAYGERGPVWIFALLGMGILLPVTRRGVWKIGERIPLFLNPWLSLWARVLWAVVAVVVFVLLRSEIHLLGDGYLMLRELSMLSARSGNEPLALWCIEQLYRIGTSLGMQAEDVFRWYSYAAGFVYVLLVFPLADELAEGEGARFLLAFALLTAGYMHIFCGYVETYSFLFTGILGYVLVGVRALKKGSGLAWVAVYLSLLTTYHYIAFMLSPSLCVLAWAMRRDGWGKIAGAFALACVLGLSVLYGLGVNPFAYTAGLRSSHFLPLAPPLDYTQAYALFSLRHGLDLINEYILVAPLAALLLLGCRCQWKRDKVSIFLALSTVGPLLFVFCANPEIGAFRDWDILAVPALPLLLWVVRSVCSEDLSGEGIVLLVAAAGLHLLSWLVLNADSSAALARYETLMQRAALSQHARSYGWETLGSYYRGEREHERAQRAFFEAVQANPDNARHWLALAGEYAANDRHEEALDALRAGEIRDPGNAQIWDLMGSSHRALAAWDSSVSAHSRAVRIDAGNAALWYNLGNAQLQAGSAAQAVVSFRRSLALDARRGEVYFNLALALESAGGRGVVEAYQAASERGFILGFFNLALWHARERAWADAERAARSFLEREGEGERAEALREFLRARPN